jgi:hypothetical protein
MGGRIVDALLILVIFLFGVWLVFLKLTLLKINLVFLPRLAGWVVRDAFENRTCLGPLIEAQRQ